MTWSHPWESGGCWKDGTQCGHGATAFLQYLCPLQPRRPPPAPAVAQPEELLPSTSPWLALGLTAQPHLVPWLAFGGAHTAERSMLGLRGQGLESEQRPHHPSGQAWQWVPALAAGTLGHVLRGDPHRNT